MPALLASIFILDHWEMRSIRNKKAKGVAEAKDFRSLGNALYPERRGTQGGPASNFRSLGNALYPERADAFLGALPDFRSLGNALYPEHRRPEA